MNDLVQFLRDRLDEDDELAATASPGPWHVDAEADEVLAVDDIVVAEGFALSGQQLRATTRHIARHDPARVFREVEAKRQLLADVLADQHFRNEEDHWYSCAALTDDQGDPLCFDDTRAPGPCDCGRDDRVARRLRLLAVPYADHPDYREDWRP